MIILDEYFNQALNNSSNILQEQYYGGNKLLDELDICFDKLIKKTEEICNKYNRERTDVSAYVDKKILGELFDYTIEWRKRPVEILKQVFNINKLNINFVYMYNAFTFINDTFYYKKLFTNKNFLFKQDKDGIKFATKDTDISINMGYQLLSMKDVTGRLMTGVLLHEMGHDFDYNLTFCSMVAKMSDILNLYALINSINGGFLSRKKSYKLKDTLKNMDKFNLSIATIITLLNQLLIIPINIDVYKRTLVESNKKSYKKEFLSDAENQEKTLFCSRVSAAIKLLLQSSLLVLYIIRLLTYKLTPLGYIGVVSDAIGSMNGKQQETFADNFATAYGYGNEVIQFEKEIFDADYDSFDQNKDNKTSNKIINGIIDFNRTLSSALTLELLDPHPNAVARCIDQIEYLKKQANSITNPAKRKQIQKDIELCEKQYENLKNLVKTDKFNDSRKAFRLLQKINIKFGGGIIYKLMKLPLFSGRKMNGDYSKLDILSDEELNEIINSDLLNEF